MKHLGWKPNLKTGPPWINFSSLTEHLLICILCTANILPIGMFHSLVFFSGVSTRHYPGTKNIRNNLFISCRVVAAKGKMCIKSTLPSHNRFGCLLIVCIQFNYHNNNDFCYFVCHWSVILFAFLSKSDIVCGCCYSIRF